MVLTCETSFRFVITRNRFQKSSQASEKILMAVLRFGGCELVVKYLQTVVTREFTCVYSYIWSKLCAASPSTASAPCPQGLCCSCIWCSTRWNLLFVSCIWPCLHHLQLHAHKWSPQLHRQTEKRVVRENQRMSMRLEVLNSVDHIITTSIMQSGDESVIERQM